MQTKKNLLIVFLLSYQNRSVPQSSALDVKAKIQYMQFTGAADFRQLDLVGAGLQKRYTLINYKF